jgi:hypothetical protein
VFADGHDVVFFFITHTHIRDAHVCMMHPAFSLFIITRANVYFFLLCFRDFYTLVCPWRKGFLENRMLGGGRPFERLGFSTVSMKGGLGVFVHVVGSVGMMGEVITCTNVR